MHAVEEAVVCPLLEQSSIAGAKAVIVNVHGGKNLLLQEFTQINNYVYKNVGADARIFSGVVMNNKEDVSELQVTVIATGFPKRDITTYAKPPEDEEIAKVREVAAKSAAENKTAAFGIKSGAPQEAPAMKSAGKVISSTGEEDLFNLGKKNSRTSPFIKTTVEEEEDINIPTFLRKLKRKREGR